MPWRFVRADPCQPYDVLTLAICRDFDILGSAFYRSMFILLDIENKWQLRDFHVEITYANWTSYISLSDFKYCSARILTWREILLVGFCRLLYVILSRALSKCVTPFRTFIRDLITITYRTCNSLVMPPLVRNRNILKWTNVCKTSARKHATLPYGHYVLV